MTDPKDIFARIESADGPALIAYVMDAMQPGKETDWHRHRRGQFFYVESGLVAVRTKRGAWALPPHRVGWMPPGELHTAAVAQDTCGWGLFIAPGAAAVLPPYPCAMGTTDLMRALVHRASTWVWQDRLDAMQERVMSVLMDELQHAPVERLELPMPVDRRLQRVARALLEHPEDTADLATWAQRAGLSTRSLSRLFRSETGHSFGQWRQQARLTHALERLAHGESVAAVADAAGYASVSAFVAMFRRCYGLPPGRYFARRAAGEAGLTP